MSNFTAKLRAKVAQKLLTPASWMFFREAATISRNRSWQPIRAQDATKTDLPWIRTVMMSHARRLRANVGFVSGIVRDLQLYTIGPNGLVPKSSSLNDSWAKEADDYFEQWSNICDVTGRFNFRQIQRLSLGLLVVDGDLGIVLTETSKGFPRIQLIEGHQIGSNPAVNTSGFTELDQGGWADGVKCNSLGQPVQYRIISNGDAYDQSSFRDIDAAAFIHVFEPERSTAQRGISHFAPVINHLRDVEDIMSYVKLGVKKDNSLPMWRETINGQNIQNQWDEALNATNKATDITLEQMLGGEIPTLKIGEKLNAFNSGKPSQETIALIDYLESDVLQAVGLPPNWKNLHREGGATLRAALIRAQYRFLELQNLLKDRELSRIRNWVVAKAAKRGDISPLPTDWWKHVWRGPAHLTADIAKVSKENREDIKFGTRTPQQDAAENGDDWREIRDDITEAADDLLGRAATLAKKHNVPLAMALELLSQRSPNPVSLTGAASNPEPGTSDSESPSEDKTDTKEA